MQRDDPGVTHRCGRRKFKPNRCLLPFRPFVDRFCSNPQMVVGFRRVLPGFLPPLCWPSWFSWNMLGYSVNTKQSINKPNMFKFLFIVVKVTVLLAIYRFKTPRSYEGSETTIWTCNLEQRRNEIRRTCSKWCSKYQYFQIFSNDIDLLRLPLKLPIEVRHSFIFRMNVLIYSLSFLSTRPEEIVWIFREDKDRHQDCFPHIFHSI